MINVENVQIKYGDFIAMDEINFEVKEGEFFTFLGPSGSGKSTMLRAIAGFLKPSKGDIKIHDKVINDLEIEDRGIGMVFQSYALFPSMSVYDNIAFGLKVEKKDKEFIDKRVRELAKVVDLTDDQLEKNISDLSGGQQQRVAITRAMAKKPEILAMDEPLSNLDAKLRKSLRGELKKIQRELNVTTLYVTHDQEEALTLSNRIAVFSNGHLEQVGTPKEIYENPLTEFVCTFIGDSNKLSKSLVSKIAPNKNISEYDSFYIRPEHISTSVNDGILNENEMIFEFESEDYYGTHYIYHLIDKESKIKISTKEYRSENNRFKKGEEVKVRFDIEKIHLFKGC
ncbi:ABC transporter ATP-binding protein [Anaerococcus sp. AGMB00486]|uniref:ABC transporter ATP-binding protein n=2 Tax=Anaerococcus TaxID=165779 RepID=A0ABX2NA66_9FIRM|nr:MULTISPECIES: ABC transporter ATP-binding protein [Anaerococcus]MSS77730.1 ABC transporter ATP-binding protein [Anaerococcus porci]NVF11585.1 ABC transporter ATP-binding protein [Anaerococcus faecalis]